MSTIAERRARIEAVHPLAWTTNLGADKPEFHAYDPDAPNSAHVGIGSGSFTLCRLPASVLIVPLHAKHAARIGTLCPTCYPQEDAS